MNSHLNNVYYCNKENLIRKYKTINNEKIAVQYITITTSDNYDDNINRNIINHLEDGKPKLALRLLRENNYNVLYIKNIVEYYCLNNIDSINDDIINKKIVKS